MEPTVLLLLVAAVVIAALAVLIAGELGPAKSPAPHQEDARLKARREDEAPAEGRTEPTAASRPQPAVGTQLATPTPAAPQVSSQPAAEASPAGTSRPPSATRAARTTNKAQASGADGNRIQSHVAMRRKAHTAYGAAVDPLQLRVEEARARAAAAEEAWSNAARRGEQDLTDPANPLYAALRQAEREYQLAVAAANAGKPRDDGIPVLYHLSGLPNHNDH